MNEKNYSLVWLDMEMTGLDPQKDSILEVAVIITDNDLNIIEEGPHLVIYQPPHIVNNMNPWCMKVHKENNLISKVQESTTSVKEAEQEILLQLKRFCKPDRAILCGNSIEQDRRFIIQYMPDLNKFLHYRHVNVTSFKEIITRWYSDHPEIHFKKKETHLALDDIRESIEELKHYRTYFFIS